MPRVYDCIVLADDQLDVLEARMEALEGVPGLVHIVCESPVTHDGEPKPLHFQLERYNRFSRFRGRWNHVVVEPHEITGSNPQEREESLREYLLHGFHGDPHDILFFGEMDIIPDPGKLEDVARRKVPSDSMGNSAARRDITAIADLLT
jgi:hypothetical protein